MGRSLSSALKSSAVQFRTQFIGLYQISTECNAVERTLNGRVSLTGLDAVLPNALWANIFCNSNKYILQLIKKQINDWVSLISSTAKAIHDNMSNINTVTVYKTRIMTFNISFHIIHITIITYGEKRREHNLCSKPCSTLYLISCVTRVYHIYHNFYQYRKVELLKIISHRSHKKERRRELNLCREPWAPFSFYLGSPPISPPLCTITNMFLYIIHNDVHIQIQIYAGVIFVTSTTSGASVKKFTLGNKDLQWTIF